MSQPKRRKSIPNPNKQHKVDVTAEGRRKELNEVQRRRARGRMLPATWITMGKPLTEMQLLNSLVTPRSKIACIGANESPKKDPSVSYLANLVRSKNVTLVDFQDDELIQKLWEIKEIKTGKPREYIERKSAEVRELERGLSYLYGHRKGSSRAIRLSPGVAWKTGIKRNSLDLILDRGTVYWTTKGEFGVTLGYEQPYTSFPILLNHYLELLKSGGRIVFMIYSRDRLSYRSLEHLRELVAKGKLNVKEVEITKEPYKVGKKHKIEISPHTNYDRAIIITKLA